MSRFTPSRILLAAVAVLAVALAGCAGQSAATPNTQTDQERRAEDTGRWLTEAEKSDALVPDNAVWVSAAFLPADADGAVPASELKTRWYAFTPREGQLDIVPVAEAFKALRDAEVDGLQNPLGAVEIDVLGYAVGTAGEDSELVIDLREGAAASRSMSSAEAQAAFSQFVGTLALHFPEADTARVTVEGQAEPELFGGLNTTEGFTLN